MKINCIIIMNMFVIYLLQLNLCNAYSARIQDLFFNMARIQYSAYATDEIIKEKRIPSTCHSIMFLFQKFEFRNCTNKSAAMSRFLPPSVCILL